MKKKIRKVQSIRMSVVGVISTHIVVKLSTVSLNFCDHFYPSHFLLNHSTVTDKAR